METSPSKAISSGEVTEQSDIYCAEPFKFVVDGKAFYVHENLITECSKPLAKMMKGPMMEAQQRVATLEGIDQGTFLRFVEWLYKGYYHAAEPRGGGPGGVAQTSTGKSYHRKGKPGKKYAVFYDSRDRDGWDYEKPETNYVVHNPAKQCFLQRQYTLRNVLKDNPQPKSNNDKDQDYSEVFMSHARLYAFADQYDIQALAMLAEEELHAVLAVFTLYPERTSDITALLPYVYAETTERESFRGLRTLMTEYIECELDILIQDKSLDDLLIEDEGPMLVDFMKVIRKRLA